MSEPTTTDAPCLAGEFLPVTELAVPISGAPQYERSLAISAGLARHWRLPVRIVHVRVAGDDVDNDVFEAIRASFRARYPDVKVASTLVTGDDVATAVEAVAHPSSLVIMSSDHADRQATPSVAERILRSVGMALMVGPHVDSDHLLGPVTAALDGSPTAEGALDAAVSFARSIGQPLELTQVVDAATTAHVATLHDRGERVSESGYLRSVADRLEADGVRVGWDIVHDDDAVRGVLDAVRRRGGGPIVVGSHGDSDLARRMLGSTAMGLVAENSYPVLVVSTRGGPEAELVS